MGKIAISLPVEQIEAAKLAVAEGRAASVSAYISAALQQVETQDTLAAFLADLEAESGPPTAEEAAEVDAFLARVDAKARARDPRP